MPTETLQDFLDTYNEGDVHNLITVDVPQSTNDTYSPFILVRFGKFAAIINPQGLGNEDDPKRHLSIDIHSFVDGKDATAGVFTMGNGRRHTLETTGTTSHGWASAPLVVALIGAQGVEDDDDES